MPDETHELVEHFFRHQSSRLLAQLTRRLGMRNIDLAEDVVQMALIEALETWKFRGVPANPSAWVFQVARNKARDALRRRKTAETYASETRAVTECYALGADDARFDTEVSDSQLRMMFACCRRDLEAGTCIAMTLRTLCGFSIKETAAALLVSPAATEKRIYRAKQLLRATEGSPEIVAGDELLRRLESVHRVLYLLFNEGYNSSHPDALIRRELCAEAMRLAELLAEHALCATSQTFALLALMLLQAARFDARLDSGGCILLLEEQDRGKWSRTLIAEGIAQLARASEGDQLSVYHLEAGIAAEHGMASSIATTDWRKILELYDLLLSLSNSPIHALNRGIVLGQIRGPSVGLAALEQLSGKPQLEEYHYFDAALADMHLRDKNYQEARRLFLRASAKTQSPPEKQLIGRKVRECEANM